MGTMRAERGSRPDWGGGPISFYGDLELTFIDGVLLRGTALLMLAVGSARVWRLIARPHPGVKYRQDWLLMARLGCSAVFLALCAAAGATVQGDASIYWLTAASTAVAIVLQWISFMRAPVSDGVLLFYWLFEALVHVARSVNFTIRHFYEDQWPAGHRAFVFEILLVASALLVLALEAGPQKRKKPYQEIRELHSSRRRNPLEKAHIFQRITFSWMSEMMSNGYRRYLTERDLYQLPAEHDARTLSEDMEKRWQRELNKRARPSLAWVLFSSFSHKILLAVLFKICHDILAFTQPQLLRLLIKFVTEYSKARGDISAEEDVPLVRGFMLAVGMFLVSVVQTTVLQQYFLQAFDTGTDLRSGITSLIYKKALHLSNEASGTSATGDIVNLMSVDAQRLRDLTQWGNVIWSGPFQLCLCLYSLHRLLGPCIWVGVVLLLFTLPLNSYISRVLKRLQKEQMKNKDERTRLISEILNNIKSLKLYAWEIPYKEKLDYVRNQKELKTLRKMGLTTAFANFQYNIIPFLVSCSTFAVFVLTQKGRPLTTDLVFPALTLFNLLSFPLAVLPIAITSFIEASVAIGRLTNFLTAEELQRDAITREPAVKAPGGVAVALADNATFLWQRKPEYKVALKNINFRAKKSELTCIIGKVGSGKSALIQAMLGDLFRVNGSAVVRGNVAYVSQVAWIMNGTVRDNILFGHKYDAKFYQQTIKACALTVDLSILPDGDNTFVGEKGISLSGGQKARLSLARAVYARADTYLLDDPLAAVDEHVAKHLLQNVFGPNGLLKSKARVLTTNKITALEIADHIVLLENGEIVQQGTFSEVISDEDSAISKLVLHHGKKQNGAPTSGESSSPSSSAFEYDVVEPDLDLEKLADEELQVQDVFSLRRPSDATFKSISFAETAHEEHREQGKVKWSIYLEYAKACNPRHVVVFLCVLTLSMFLSVMGGVWLKHWSEVNTRYGYNPNVALYLGVYFMFGLGASLSTLIQSAILWIYCSIHASVYLHESMLAAVLRAPMSFFETTPIGRILNRFSNDIYKVDELLARTFSQFFANTTRVSFTIIVICVTTWQFTFFVIPLAMLYIYYQQYYLKTSRELRRLDSVTKSPVYAHFQETLNGVSSIRGYGQLDRFIHINQARINNNTSAYYPSMNVNRWLAYRLEFIGSCIIFFAATLSVFRLASGSLTSGMVGLSLSYALQITQSLNWIVRMTVEVETNIVSVERIKEYAELEPEAPQFIANSVPSGDWPKDGEIKFENYSTRYRPGLDLILRGINLHIKPHERVGIVGRTGAGKSSLALSLFRIIEAAEGHISIDGVPIDTIGLTDLRKKLSIIPQDSQVFEGTVRDNIDPTKQYTDEQIWKALELSHLADHVKGMGSDGLDTPLTEGGKNLSVGQRQLMCLARALLIPSRILVLDEATAAIDVETDKVIQDTIRSSFNDRTILTIAHRINTIMDSDKIVVLDKGTVAEFDTPENLLKKKEESIFYTLCKEAGLTS
ncbi:AGR047Wp [Eremothecium gossypii ATCC 10895]|uniref:AGR047Wp n=1 Tax=Eremothecium gossypii (strain ATCC 10895 / CBS 109.51 / FGSC 9923 / NRRL Y-1056) TaxID=284811 RepID=Q750B0_EREGS|nr:AGR047Wp [Eremothecium gossypii ATCC 10895]AAS54536.2 AGR047Wp [Eremothecium gossypii ATCC 10895]AEY98868.1 FAGR047Wp [Eremothecium gossypii FDAG1]